LLIDRNWRAITTLATTTLPGLAWAAVGHSVNKAAVPVNYFARLANIREYWWNPRLYIDPWWPRSVLFSVYDALGLFGLFACAWAALTGMRKRPFEAALLVLPAAITIVVFNYHSASHHYYTLIWLPFVIVAVAEVSLHRMRTLDRGRVMVPVLVLAVAGIAERQAGLVERYVARQPDAAAPLFHARFEAPSAGDAVSRAALADLKGQRVSFVGYLGNSWMPLLDLDMRGWVVEAPTNDQDDQRHSRVPITVIRAEERFRLSADWFRDRLARGMGALLIERGGPFDKPEVIEWAREAGLRPASVQPPGHILLR